MPIKLQNLIKTTIKHTRVAKYVANAEKNIEKT